MTCPWQCPGGEDLAGVAAETASPDVPNVLALAERNLVEPMLLGPVGCEAVDGSAELIMIFDRDAQRTHVHSGADRRIDREATH